MPTSDVPLCPALDLKQSLADCVHQIPAGHVATFGDIAHALGDRIAAQWVAATLNAYALESTAAQDEPATGLPSGLPWHRVVRQTGELDDRHLNRYHRQRERLSAEGSLCAESSLTTEVRVDMNRRWQDFQTSSPLQTLAEWQTQIASLVDERDQFPEPRTIAGIDVSYASPLLAVAAYVEMEWPSQRILAQYTLATPVEFPYIPGYLTFRELPVYQQLLRAVRGQRDLAEILLVDGQGQLHPRQAGIAVAVGVCESLATIGVAKHHLAGTPGLMPDVSPGTALWLADRWQGVRFSPGDAAAGRKQRSTSLEVSPGHRVSVEQAWRIVRHLPYGNGTIQPVGLADRLSRHQSRLGQIPGQLLSHDFKI